VLGLILGEGHRAAGLSETVIETPQMLKLCNAPIQSLRYWNASMIYRQDVATPLGERIMCSHRLRVFLAVGTVLIFGGASSAFARCSSGEIANFFCEKGIINKSTANAADAAHAAAGNPLDRVGHVIAQNYGVPLTPYCATQWGVGISNWGLPGTPCQTNGMPGFRVQ